MEKNGPLVELRVVPNSRRPGHSSPALLMLMNVTGNAWGSRQVPGVGGTTRSTGLGDVASSDPLAGTLTMSRVYATLSLESGVSPRSEGEKSFVRIAERPPDPALNQSRWAPAKSPCKFL